jgi:hypothetical protein
MKSGKFLEEVRTPVAALWLPFNINPNWLIKERIGKNALLLSNLQTPNQPGLPSYC